MARPVSSIDLTPEERANLRRRIGSPTSSQRDAMRARIVLLRAKVTAKKMLQPESA